MKFKTLILLLLAITAATCVSAADNLTHYELKFDEFHELKVVDGINVDYYCDSSKAGKVEFEAAPDVASAVMFEPSKGKLSIKLALRDGSYRNLPTIRVYSSYLTKVSNEGDSLVRVMSTAAGPKFYCRVMGNGRMSVRDIQMTNVEASILSGHGTISIFGNAQNVRLKVTGAGQIQADELQASDVDCTVTGTGIINCYATENLKYGGVGSGKVFYRGTPEIKKGLLTTVKVAPIENRSDK